MLSILGTALIVAMLLSSVLIVLARSDLIALSDETLDELRETSLAAFDQGLSASIERLSGTLVNFVYYEDFESIGQQLKATKNLPFTESVLLLDADGKVLHEGGKDFPRLGLNMNIEKPHLDQLRAGHMVWRPLKDNSRIAMKGIFLGEELLGIVYVSTLPYNIFGVYEDAIAKLDEIAQQRILFYSLSAIGITTLLLLLAGAGSWYAAGRLAQPIKTLQKQAEHMGSGDLQIDNRIERPDEIGDLAKSIYTMAADLELQNRSVKYLAFHDPLTGIANRSSFQMDLEDQIVKAAERIQSCALMFVDIDDFKGINDACGHDLGDRALKTIADRISDGVHEFFETGELNPSIARIGGDEFTIIVPGNKDTQGLRQIAERVLELVAKPLMVEGELYQLSASIGIASYPRDGLSTSTLLNAADKAMYNSKSAGKGTYRFFDESMTHEDRGTHQITSDFKQALSRPGELQLLYQPIANIRTGAIHGGEALMRWHHPTMGTLEPGQFISVVENNEIALAADLWVIEKTLDILETMDLTSRPNFVISANISASNLGREQFPEAVARLLKQSPVDARHLQLEITETYLHRDESKALESLKALKKLGVKLWLDDFCTGYSSLKHLNLFPTNGIKIDRQFVIGLNKHNEDRLLVSAMISLANSFNIGVVAEGIDNQTDRELLMALECELGQGDLFSKPVPADTFVEMVIQDQRLPLGS